MFVIKLFIVLLFIILPFGELIRFDIGNNIILKPLDVVAGILSTLTIFVLLHKKKLVLKWQFFFFPLLGILTLIINSIWLKPNELFTSSLYLIRWISYISIFFAFWQLDARYKKKLQLLLFLDGLIILVSGFIQYFFYSDLRNLYYLGWDEHMHRMFSTFLDPNFAGVFFVLYFIFIAGILFHNSHKLKRTYIYSLSSLLLVTLIAIFLTYSRSALLMLFVSSFTFLVLIKKKKLLIVLIGLVVLFVLIVSPSFSVENTNLFRINSSKARIETTQNALKIIQDNPIFGVGFNSYRYAQQRYGFREKQPPFPSHADAGVDNSFLFVLATAGIIGFVAYVIFLKSILMHAYLLYRKRKDLFALIIISSMTGLVINAFFINSLFYPTVALWMLILIGCMKAEG